MWIHIKGEKRRCIELCIGSFRTPQEAAVARAGDGARAGNGGVAVDGGRGVGCGDRPSAVEGSTAKRSRKAHVAYFFTCVL